MSLHMSTRPSPLDDEALWCLLSWFTASSHMCAAMLHGHVTLLALVNARRCRDVCTHKWGTWLQVATCLCSLVPQTCRFLPQAPEITLRFGMSRNRPYDREVLTTMIQSYI